MKAGYGFIFSHTDKIRHLVEGHVPTLALQLDRPATLNRDWRALYKDPVWGGELYFAELANPDELGWGLGGHLFIDLPLSSNGDGGLWFRTGGGVGYIRHPFDRSENVKNWAIGSFWNTFFHFRLSWKKCLGWDWRIGTGIGYGHFSNGAVNLPNLGINVPALHLNVAHKVAQGHYREEGKAERTVFRAVEPENPHRFRLVSGGGIKEAGSLLGEKYGAVGVQGEYDHRISGRSYLGVGLDGFYDRSLRKKVRSKEGAQRGSGPEFVQLGAKLSYSLVVGNLTLLLQKGAYLYTPFLGHGRFYHRVGARYQWSPRWLFNFSLKSHYADADHMEIGVGYVLPFGNAKPKGGR